jgi:hypothetical protein
MEQVMPNYAEELVYWYLRLNGFFPLANFVYHRLPRVGGHGIYNADADILAIRPPFYRETIFSGEQERELLSDGWLQVLEGKWVGLIGEVKGSPNVTGEAVERAFSVERLRVAVMRLGLLPTEMVENAANELSDRNQFEAGENNEIIFLKVLFADVLAHNQNVMHSYLWFTKNLREMDDFIRQRIQQFPEPKSGGRYFFPSSFFQYMVWQERPEHFDE